MTFEISRTSAASVSKAASNVEFVDLSEAPAKARIVRQGYDVPAVKVDARRVDQFVGDLAQIPTRDLPRVVSQSIPGGTKVAAGTSVDLVLAPRTTIPFDIFEAVHADLSNKTLDAIDAVYADAAARKTLLTYETAAEVPASEKTHLVATLQEAGVSVDDSNPARTFAMAFDSARGGLAFQE